MCKKKAKDTKSDDEKTRDVVGPLSSENRIALMAVLRDEWKYRDQTFCLYFWRFIYLSLVVAFLPAFLKATGMEIAIIDKVPLWCFSFLGVLFSGFGMYIGWASTKRMESVNDAYQNILKAFPSDYVPRTFEERTLKPSLNRLLCIVSYSLMIVLAVINMAVTR